MAPFSFYCILMNARKLVSILIGAAFFTSAVHPAYAQVPAVVLPKPGVMVNLSPEFTPAILEGMTIHPDNALTFDFIINRGEQELDSNRKKEEYRKLVKYFLASLTVPDNEQWVNLSPYEKERIITNDFGKTQMGRDLLAEDYILKQLTSSLIYPESNLGKKFWDRIYERAWNEYHTTTIPVNTFNKVWIVPDQAIVYESGNSAYILQSHLKVMLEEDYLSLAKHAAINSDIKPQANDTHTIGSQVIREIILPELEKEVNEGANFANLRQIFSGMILATWYKKALKDSLLGKIYADKSKVKGVDQNPRNNDAIYQRYIMAFKKGVFNYIREDVDKYTNEEIPRKYFSGGWLGLDMAMSVTPENVRALKGRQRIVEVVGENNIDLVKDQLSSQAMSALASSGKDVASIALETPRQDNGQTAAPRKQTIILIDDEFVLLENNKATLEEAGYNVLTAETFQEADQVWAAHKNESAGIVTDFKNDREQNPEQKLWSQKVREFKKERPEIPVLVISGAEAEHDKAWQDIKGVKVQFLPKPFLAPQLVAKIKEIIPAQTVTTTNQAMRVAVTPTKTRVLEEKINSFLAPYGKTVVLNYSRNFIGNDNGFAVVPGENGTAYLSINVHPNLSVTSLLHELETMYLAGISGEERDRWAEIAKTPFTHSIPYNLKQLQDAIETMPLKKVNERIGWVETRTRASDKDFLSYEPHSNFGFSAEEVLHALFKRLNGIEWRDKKENGSYRFISNFDLNNAPDLNDPLTLLAISLLGQKSLSAPNPEITGGPEGFLPVDHSALKPPSMLTRARQAAGTKIHNALVTAGLKAGPKRNAAQAAVPALKGGIDLNAANLNLFIKRDGQGVPLPWSNQDLNRLSKVQGFIPQIIEIKPAVNLPILSELQQKLQSA